ncbi:CaiB/BaiF CoA transferase family protein [Gordonia shandongensis]|uniref:CaiB/BaiF CoA transferase family protein n=1 Tax=Gordonia shandongensis TaxID=376351 RepID=UPI0003FB7164|nr:CaiB/BaiF CoA-transferase family protein [Gordonia shandongensis]
MRSDTDRADETEANRGALADLRVLELGTLIAGPFAGRLLGDLGADVIKIEAPGKADPLRTWGQAEVDGERAFWTVQARNKRAISLDLRTDEGREIFLDLVDRSDIVVENFRPGTLEKWGLDYETLAHRNPGIILARVSGYGQTGPAAYKPGYASVAEGVSGLRYINGFPGGPAPRLSLSIGDSLAGMFAVQGILAAVHSRHLTGRGQVVDVALTEACLAMLESTIPDYDLGGVVREPSGTRLSGIAPSNLYRTRDERWVIIAANQDTVFRRLCTVIGREDLIDDERTRDHVARGEHEDLLDEIIGAWVADRDAAAVIEVMAEAGVVAGPVNTVADVVADDQFRAREMLVPHADERLGREVLGPGVVPKLSETPGSIRSAGPATVGRHNREVYTGLLGLDEARVAELAAAGVI